MKKIVIIFIICLVLSSCSKERQENVLQDVTETNMEKSTQPAIESTTQKKTHPATESTTQKKTHPATENTTEKSTAEEFTTEAVKDLDPTLEEAIRIELGVGKKVELTDDMLKSITYLAAFETPITSLDGISRLENLTELHISKGQIMDISELCKLKKLYFIDISNCYIKKIPDFSGLKQLESLYLCNNLVEDISPINKIKSLKYVNLSSNRISSISPLKKVKRLESLSIDGNCILDYYTITNNKKLISAIDNGSQGKYSQFIQVENEAKKIVGSFGKNLTELEMEKKIYQYIIDNTEYEVVSGMTSAFGYYALMEGKGVCGDYAEGFCMLANHAGIETYVCGSDTHAWNIVNIGGKYYHCDALWDEGMDEWIYFNVNAKYILDTPDHTYDISRYPICE